MVTGQQSSAPVDPPPDDPLTFGVAWRVGVLTALIGGTALGVVEAAAFLWITARRFSESGTFPAVLAWGYLARGTLTHAICWLGLGMLYSLPIAYWTMRRGRKGSRLPLEALHWLIFILLAGIVVLPADLILSNRFEPVMGVVVTLGTLTLAGGVFMLIWWMSEFAHSRAYRSFLRVCGTCCVLLAAGCAAIVFQTPFCGAGSYSVPSGKPTGSAPTHARPNVLLIVMDTVRADHMSCYGYDKPTTPFLERFAEDSTIYTRAVANANWTVPSHASMFTGLPGRQHGATRSHAWLEDEHRTVAESLADAGYFTACFSNNPHVSKGRNFTQGFEFAPEMFVLPFLDQFSLTLCFEWLGMAPPFPWMEGDLGSRFTNAYLARWLDGETRDPRPAEKPWLIFVNFLDAHIPYAAPKRYRRMFMEPKELRRSYALRRRAYGEIIETIQFRFNMLDNQTIDPADRVVLAKQYDACIRYLDRRVEEMLGLFEARGLLKNTAVIITSDHGESLGEHSFWEHTYGVYHTLAHVPLIVRYPDGTMVGRLDYLVQPSDLFPTISSLADIPYPTGVGKQCRDLAQLNDRNTPERIAVAEYLAPWLLPVFWAEKNVPGFERGTLVRELRGVVSGRHKYIWASDGRHELYDLDDDPGETRNLIDRETGVRGRLDTRLRSWETQNPSYQYPPGARKPDLPADMVRQLKSLGYLN